jgi:tetratricopeptide (TPR) repeat protein
VAAPIARYPEPRGPPFKEGAIAAGRLSSVVVSPRLRVSLLVALAASAAAGVTVAATVLMGGEGAGPAPAARPRQGVPPLVLDLGVRDDEEARALRRAALLYGRGRRAEAERLFLRYPSDEARVGAALAAWPAGFERLAALAEERPRSGVVQLHLGLALYWRGLVGRAQAAWRRAKAVQPDSLYAVRAADLLHPEDPVPGLPQFVPSFPSPPGLARLSPPQQLALLARRARQGGAREKILYGVALQRLGRPLSARRQLAAAAALAPRDAEAQTAAAVALFDKDRPQLAFARLGPLARAFPRRATVRFHLGLLLLWLGRVEEARRQFRLARAVEPGSRPAREAGRFLEQLAALRPAAGG